MSKGITVFAMAFLVGCNAVSPTRPSVVTPPPTMHVPTELQGAFALLDTDPWMHPLLGRRLGEYVRSHVAAIRMDPSLPLDVGARSIISRREILWQPANTSHRDVQRAGLLLHEARHFESNAWHSCGTHDLAGDKSMAEGGPFAVQIIYLEHMGETADAQWYKDRYIGCR